MGMEHQHLVLGKTLVRSVTFRRGVLSMRKMCDTGLINQKVNLKERCSLIENCLVLFPMCLMRPSYLTGFFFPDEVGDFLQSSF